MAGLGLVTLLTPTGGRPEAWALCQKYMATQTYKGPIQWIIVDDCPDKPSLASAEIEKAPHIKQEFYISSMPWRPGINTQRINMIEALKHVKGDYIFVIEDDDCYMPTFLESLLFLLQKYEIVGQCNSRYYNLKERAYKEWRNYQHTSLCETGLRRSKLDLLDRAVNSGQLFFDIALWQIVYSENHSHLIFDHIGLMCGIKGMPGKQGIGGGHVPDKTFTRDPFFEKLKQWVGQEYAKAYIDIIQGKK